MSSPLVLSPRHSTESSPVFGAYDGYRRPASASLSQEYMARSSGRSPTIASTARGLLSDPPGLMLGSSRRTVSSGTASGFVAPAAPRSAIGAGAGQRSQASASHDRTAGRSAGTGGSFRRPSQAQRRAIGATTTTLVYTPMSPMLQAAQSPSIPCTPLLLDPTDPFAAQSGAHSMSVLNLAAAAAEATKNASSNIATGVASRTTGNGEMQPHLIAAALSRAVNLAAPPSTRRRSGAAHDDGARTPTDSREVGAADGSSDAAPASPSRRLYSSVVATASPSRSAAGQSQTQQRPQPQS